MLHGHQGFQALGIQGVGQHTPSHPVTQCGTGQPIRRRRHLAQETPLQGTARLLIQLSLRASADDTDAGGTGNLPDGSLQPAE